jgi:hypothetical protein
MRSEKNPDRTPDQYADDVDYGTGQFMCLYILDLIWNSKTLGTYILREDMYLCQRYRG